MLKSSSALRAVVSTVLSAIVAAGGHGFSSIHHRHDDGGHPHHHHAHGGHGHAHARHAEPRAARTARSSTHAHYAWLGVPLPFPVPVDEDATDPADVLPAVVTARGGEGPSFVAWSGTASATCLPRNTLPPSGADRIGPGPSPQVSALPLCARATHERSGVQLA